MNKSILFAVGAAISLFGISSAQDTNSAPEKVPPPKPPLIARAPQRSSWIIQVTPKGNGPVAPSLNPSLPLKYLKQQTWTKSGTLMRCENEWTDGSKTEDWIIGGAKLYQNPQVGGIQMFSPLSNAGYHDFSSGDFEKLDWLTLGDYVGVVQHSGETCYFFRARTLLSTDGPFDTVAEVNAPKTPTSVFVSVRTHLPVSIDNGDGEYQFQFLQAPAGELKMPASYASVWALMNHR